MKVAIFLCAIVALSAATPAEEYGFLDDLLKDSGKQLIEIGQAAVDNVIKQATDGLVDLTQKSLADLLKNLGSIAGKRDLTQISDLVNKFQSSVAFLKKFFSYIKVDGSDIIEKLVKKSADLFEKVKKGEITDDLILEIRKIVAEAQVEVEKLGSKIITGLLGSLTSNDSAESKRFLSDTIQSIVDLVTPLVDNLKSIVADIGAKLQNHAITVSQAISQSAAELQTKLGGHLDQLKKQLGDLKGHGSTAINALNDAITDILKQTLQNAGDTINKQIMETIRQAATTVTQHIVDSIKGSGTM